MFFFTINGEWGGPPCLALPYFTLRHRYRMLASVSLSGLPHLVLFYFWNHTLRKLSFSIIKEQIRYDFLEILTSTHIIIIHTENL